MSKLEWQPAYIALGSNLGDSCAEVQQAIRSLYELPATCAWQASALYRSAPMGPQDQPAFINAVVGCLTQLTPEVLLAALHGIEQRMGRVRIEHWGPRIIDLDLLMVGAQRMQTDTLTLPHPGLLERNFVVVPLADIAPTMSLSNGRTVAQHAAMLGQHGLERLP